MSYQDYDESVKLGRPFWLYQFGKGATTNYFTSDRYEIVRNSLTWTPKPISHNDIEENGNVEKNELQLTFGLSDEFALDYMIPVAEPTTITIFRGFHEDEDEELSVRWKGRVLGAASKKHTIEMRCENIFTSMRRIGCGVRVSRTCRHSLYSVPCGAVSTSFDHAVTITAVNGTTVTVPAAAGFTAGQFSLGILEWNSIKGMIEVHNGSSIQLVADIPGLEEALEGGSQAGILYDGCNRLLTSDKGCTHFDQTLNWGGFKWIPSQNPFNSSIL